MSGIAEHTPGPWFVDDLRASRLRALGWVGPSIDKILICSCSPEEIARTEDGSDCIIARIAFDNRPEELGESNLADAKLIAAAPVLLDIHAFIQGRLAERGRDGGFILAADLITIDQMIAQALDDALEGGEPHG